MTALQMVPDGWGVVAAALALVMVLAERVLRPRKPATPKRDGSLWLPLVRLPSSTRQDRAALQGKQSGGGSLWLQRCLLYHIACRPGQSSLPLLSLPRW